MKIGILTFHYAHNYGAVLQAYALKQIIQSEGHEVVMIPYKNDCIMKSYPRVLPFRIGKKDIVFPGRWPTLWNKIRTRQYGKKSWSIQWQRFEEFIQQCLVPKESHCVTKDMLSQLDLDHVVYGSDQIWASYLTGGFDPVYFGQGIPSCVTKSSYAASMGHVSQMEGKEEFFLETLKEMTGIGVREGQLENKLTGLGLDNVAVNLDPTLLLDGEEYHSFLLPNQEKQKYIFAYFVVESPLLMAFAQEKATQCGLALVELHYYLQPSLKNHRQYADFGPKEFLTYIKNAEYVVTNSFHGTVFSLLFQRPFYCVYEEGKNNRIDNLLGVFGLQQRHIGSVEQFSQEVDEISFEDVAERLGKSRQESRQFLLASLARKKEENYGVSK